MPQPAQKILPVVEKLGEVRHGIRPSNIHVGEPVSVGSFGKAEVEEAAGRLVMFFQKMGRWGLFTITELAAFYRRQGWNPDQMFFGLSGTWFDDGGLGSYRCGTYLIQFRDGYCVTEMFIDRCTQQSH